MTISSCGKTVRTYDPDRFLLSLFGPANRREALWALYAFNHEIAKTREVVTETQLGLIRLQWWKDAIVDIYNGKLPPKNDVLEMLAMAIRENTLPQDLFDQLMYAREFDLEDRLPSSVEGMVKYAEFTSLPLMRLSITIAEPGNAKPPSDKAIRDIATAYALTGRLRSIPMHTRQGRSYLPAGRFAREKQSPDDNCAGKRLEALTPVVRQVVEVTETLSTDDGGNRWLRLNRTLLRMYLKQIKACGYDVFSPRLSVPPLARGIRLWIKSH